MKPGPGKFVKAELSHVQAESLISIEPPQNMIILFCGAARESLITSNESVCCCGEWCCFLSELLHWSSSHFVGAVWGHLKWNLSTRGWTAQTAQTAWYQGGKSGWQQVSSSSRATVKQHAERGRGEGRGNLWPQKRDEMRDDVTDSRWNEIQDTFSVQMRHEL